MRRRFRSASFLIVGLSMCVAAGCSSQPAPEEKPAEKPAAVAPVPRPAPATEAKAAPTDPAPADARPRRPAAAPAPKAAPTPAPAPAAREVDGAMVEFTADVPDAQVFVDRVFIGKAPMTTTDVKPGSHRLNVSAAGFEGVAQTIDVKPGMQQIAVKLREVRLDAGIDVIHKHRMGTCKGRLIATARGLRYDTSDHDDAFTTPLLDLATFEIDYLEKNLRIKLKNGRQLNFTDPDGNADRLFVFHRDVEKARERLKKGDTPAE